MMISVLLAAILLQQAPAFEVASVHLHRGDEFRPSELMVSSSLVRLRGYTVFGLALDAFHVKDYQLRFENVSRAEDVYDDRYDISARTPGEGVPDVAGIREMLLSLLVERFSMRYHRETKEMSVYELVTAKGGVKLRKSAGAGPCTVKTRLAPDGRNDINTFSACTLDELAGQSGIADRPVIDRTGILDRFDFTLLAAPEYRTRKGGGAADISPITALGDLGLKLVPAKASVVIVVIDHVAKPSEN